MNRVLGFAAVALLALAAGCFAVWSAAALYFSHPGDPALGLALAACAGSVGLAASCGVLLARWRRRAIVALAALVTAVLAWWSAIEPSNDRHWKAESAVAPHATIDGDRVTVHNIRNFHYRTETDYDVRYYDKTFDLRQLQGLDVVASYWMGPHIAHIFLSFDFGDGGHLAISIERRDEVGEGYSTIKGLFRQFELYYVVADERDVIRLRTNIRAEQPEQVYLYRVQGTAAAGRAIFLDYLREINSLQAKPEFYNTLTTNCTSNIWMHTRVNAGHMPYSWKILVSGHVPEFLYEQGRLFPGMSFAELQEKSNINARAQAAGDDPEFSRRIRADLPGMGN